ncbi:unnamed protein product [Polarella glacialis]|uniref:Peptidase C45 hydrolase domain-containing protein n=1 Tax=Polarella glacialis TaxID=89957 RepID=A0A813EJ71_POLGL|nr:unnamed protein product [Polarella glacialis]
MASWLGILTRRAFQWPLVVCLCNVIGSELSEPSFIRTVFVEYNDDDSQGHFEFGHALGEAMGDVIHDAWASDTQLQNMEDWIKTQEGRRIFDNLVSNSTRAFPLYSKEIEGMAAGAKIPLQRLLVNQLREELSQWVDAEQKLRRAGHCTDAYAVGPEGTAAWGHNDDWNVYWRKQTYFVIATALDAGGNVKFKFGSWGYPGYLVGMQLNWNSFGLAWTCNSLFPTVFSESGVGTAWVARHMAEARSVEDLVRRAADKRVSTAMNYNIGSVRNKTLWNLEVDTGGVHALQRITTPYVHTNQFKLLNVSQFAEESSAHRQARWEELRPTDVSGLRSFLSDRTDEQWPVWRNGTRGDDCFTEVTGIFDLQRQTLSVWTSPAAARAPEMELSLNFPRLPFVEELFV